MAGKADYIERAAARIDRAERAERGVGDELVHEPQGGLFEVGWGAPREEAERTVSSWFRVPSRGELVVAVLCEQPVRFKGHWDQRRMQLCPGEATCGYCRVGFPRQTRWALSVHELGQGCTGLLEIGAQAAADLESWALRRGTFRGLVCKFKKENGVKTGRIQVFPSDAVINPGELPQALDVAGALRASFSRLNDGHSLN